MISVSRHSPSRLDGHPSPSKRQRTSLYESSPSSSSRTQSPTPNVLKEREDSRIRLLGVWAGLAQRYSRHMDDDDVVDIMTGEITQDNGVLRNFPTLQFGTLSTSAYETDESEVAEFDSDLDELDALTDAGFDTEEEYESEAGGLIAPFTLLNQSYADDVQDFLKAEKVRKQICGSDVDEVSEDEQFSQEEEKEGDEEEEEEEDVEQDVEEDDEDDQPDVRQSRPVPKGNQDRLIGIKRRNDHSLEPLIVSSDDELDFWNDDESDVWQTDDELDVWQSDNFVLQ